jgi:hypothetical protein
MSKMKQLQIAFAAALLMAVAAPAFAEGTHCSNRVGLCDKGEQRSEPDRSPSVGGGDTDSGEPDTGEPSIE